MPEEPTEQEPLDHTGTTINRVEGDSGTTLQARDVHGNVNFGAHSDTDVEIVLLPEQPEVVVEPGGECTSVPVTVKSHLAEPVTVTLSLRGAPTSQWAVEPSEVTVLPGKRARARLRLPCTATEPSAGPKHLHVVARHRDGNRTWRSESGIDVSVRAEPGLAVAPDVTPAVLKGGEQTVTVTVRNTGNTHLLGALKRWTTSGNDAGYLPRDGVALPPAGASFELPPGEAADLLAGVTLPPPELTEKKWCLPIAAWLKGAEDPCVVPELTVTQPGWLSEIPGYVNRLAAWGRVKHGPYRRATLAVSGLAVFLGGLLFGASVFSSQPAGDAAAAAAPPSSQPAAASPVPPRFAPVPREPMACTPGTTVVYLASMTKGEADEYAAYFVQREYSRMNDLKPVKLHYPIHVTDRAGLCPGLRQKLDRSPSMADYSTFVWIGVPTSEGADICQKLDRRQTFDCLAVPLT
ncbi:hypothetical protein [Amycolatopsis vancoresmycina]|uniref:Uncharacterized protein n=1 Tax=Amycolatopsis vancoresmycina DSM 44592 TaxID=1292037 RepID=R1I4G9_9PSEU|nr:hypothetical protein [Amycolatopsis vancoresmycina]EOD67406.1 hypothetical protein H480_16655 [Amycolatopsis vancoresmycina DSM 44592]